MDELYDIYLGQQPIGHVRLRKQGLYYCFFCQCRLTGEVIYKVVATCGEKEVSLGVCVPQGSSFCVNTRIPIKEFGNGKFTFRVVPQHRAIKGVFIPIRSDEPFAYICRLCDAHLETQNNNVGIIVRMDLTSGADNDICTVVK